MAAIASTTSPMRFDPTPGITDAELAAVAFVARWSAWICDFGDEEMRPLRPDAGRVAATGQAGRTRRGLCGLVACRAESDQ